jgi:transcriptional regulator with XRE-family HTH domain
MLKSLHSADYRHFLTELRQVREAAGITQEALAAALGEHQTLVSKVERGVRRIDVVELRVWLTALGVKLPDFALQVEERLSRNVGPRPVKPRLRTVR